MSIASEIPPPGGRANMYRFLAAVYRGPLTREALRAARDEEFLDELGRLYGEPAVAELRSFAAGDGVQDWETLKQEYMDILAVPTGRYVMPFEDVYRGETLDGRQIRGPLLGERAIAVQRRYREAGAAMDRASRELPTHVGVELAFMEFLCAMEAAEPDSTGRAISPGGRGQPDLYRDLQRRFLREHLNAWFPRLSRAIQARARYALYRGLAQLTEAVLERDTAGLVDHAAEAKRAGD